MRNLLLVILLFSGATHAAPRVVASIAPLQEIVATITAGVTEPGVIVPGHASLHHFAFRPSHMRLLEQADLVVWVDRGFEAGFYKLPEILPATTSRLELAPALGAGAEEAHFWYSPRLLLASLDIIADRLAQLDPANRDIYRRNAAALAQQVRDWRDEVSLRWRARQPRVLTDHEFLAPLARDIGLDHIVALHDSHHDQGGLKELRQLEDRLRAEPLYCLLGLEPTPSPLSRSVAEKYRLRYIDLGRADNAARARASILGRLDRLGEALDSCSLPRAAE